MENTSKIKYILYLNDISEVENLYYEGLTFQLVNTRIYNLIQNIQNRKSENILGTFLFSTYIHNKFSDNET